MGKIALIAGTGFDGSEIFQTDEEMTIETAYGEVNYVPVSMPDGTEIILLMRHGKDHHIPPHAIPYRANMMALQQLGVDKAIGVNAVGGLRRNQHPGTIVLCDQFLDFTKARPFTFFDGDDGRVVHTDISFPFCEELRTCLLQAAAKEGKLISVSTTTAICCLRACISRNSRSAWTFSGTL